MFLHQLEVFGTILKSHGYQGEVIASVEGFIPPHFEMPESVFIVVDGIPVPFFTEYYEIISDNSVKIKFDTIHSREETMRYYNCGLMAGRNFVSRYFPEKRNVSFTGYTVLDEKGKNIGVITDFDNIPGNPVITVDTGTQMLMLPVHAELIVKLDEKARKIILHIPEGLVK
jgi:16S rRNA processing protein RimM